MSAQPMVAAKTERLLNLVICLLYTRRPLTKEQIRRAVVLYADTVSDEAFDRMFERDKEELRELGVPLVTESVDVFFDDEIGYRIDRREYALPEISFTSDELAVLGLASRAWQQASLAGPAAAAMRKLAAAGVERDDASVIGLEPRVRTVEPAFEPLRKAVGAAYPVHFPYRTGGAGPSRERRVQPWALMSWSGRWYLTGYDVDRQAPRVYRLSRIRGPVTRDGKPGSYQIPEHDPAAMIAPFATDPEAMAARLLVRSGAGHALRRRSSGTGAGEMLADAADWDELTVEFGGLEPAAIEVAGYGPDVRVLEPAELVDAVVARLRGALEVHQEASS